MPLTELEKVAIFFVAIGPERAEGILKRLGSDAMMRIAGAMKRLGPISAGMRQAVLKEMLDLLSGQRRSQGLPKAGPFRGENARADTEADLLGRMSDLFDRDVDIRALNWDAAGLNFDASPPSPDDDADDRPGRRF